MSATFNWVQTNGAPAGVSTILGSSGNLADFQNADVVGTSQYTNYPIPAGSNSFEVWLRGCWSGVFNSISDIRFWMSTPFSPNTGLSVLSSCSQQTYQQPTNATSSIATSVLGTSDPGTRNVTTGGSLTSSILATGYSDFVVLQLQTQSSAPAGDTSLATFSLSYIET